MKSLLNRRSVSLGVATAANFGAVLVGLWVISRYSSGDDQVALLNLWAAWGIALGLLGQVGLISGVLDRQEWVSQRNILWAVLVAVLIIAVLAPVRRQLFPQNELWVVFAGVMAGALFVLGRQRADLSLRQRGVSAVAVTAAENVIRALFLTVVLVTDRPTLGAVAIAAPLAVSLVVFASLSAGDLEPKTSAMGESRSVAVSLLAGVPAVLAYAVVPILTLFGSVEALDLVAFAATLLRGPLILAAFLAPWFLGRVPQLNRQWRRHILFAAALSTAVQVVFGLTSNFDGALPLLVSAVLASVTAVTAYLLVVLSPSGISTNIAISSGTAAIVAATSTMFVLRDQPTYLAFLGVGFASLLIVVMVSTSNSQAEPNGAPPASAGERSSSPFESGPSRAVGKEAA